MLIEERLFLYVDLQQAAYGVSHIQAICHSYDHFSVTIFLALAQAETTYS